MIHLPGGTRPLGLAHGLSMPVAIVICIVVIVVAGAVSLIVRAARSRSEKSDWLGELSEIRRSSLGDDEEVTGALEAVTVMDEPVPTDEPELNDDLVRRTVSDEGTTFDEMSWHDGGLLRVEVRDDSSPRVVLGQEGAQVAVGITAGICWNRPPEGSPDRRIVIRLPGGWVTPAGGVLILASKADWNFVMCLEGNASIRLDEGGRVALQAGQVARLRAGTSDHDIVDAGIKALEAEAAVQRQRGMDERTRV